MKVNSFYSHSLHERIAFVKRLGDFIGRIKYYGFYVNLYAVEGHYIEVFYNIHSQVVEEVEVMDPKDDRLNLYAVPVDLSDLYNKS